MTSGWWVSRAWFGDFGPPFVIAWAFWVILSITLHELSHGWAAIRLGDRTPIEQGRMVFNPIVHMGQMSLFMFAVIGIAWGAMPINPRRMRGRHAEAIVAFAGPAMNLVLAFTSLVLLALWLGFIEGQWAGGVSIGDSARKNMVLFFRLGIMLNVLLFVLNMLPVFPLDGGRILGHFVPSYRRVFDGQAGPAIMIGMMILLFMVATRVVFPGAMQALSVVEGAVFDALHLHVDWRLTLG